MGQKLSQSSTEASAGLLHPEATPRSTLHNALFQSPCVSQSVVCAVATHSAPFSLFRATCVSWAETARIFEEEHLRILFRSRYPFSCCTGGELDEDIIVEDVSFPIYSWDRTVLHEVTTIKDAWETRAARWRPWYPDSGKKACLVREPFRKDADGALA